MSRWPEETATERLARLSEPGPGGCILFTGSLDSHGYGQVGFGHLTHLAHRLAYEALVGPLTPGMTLDHVCHSRDASCAGGRTCVHRRCINPEHLEEVTMAENTARGRSLPAMNARKTHCHAGHPYDAANTRYRANGARDCRICRKARDRARYLRDRHIILPRMREQYHARKAAA